MYVNGNFSFRLSLRLNIDRRIIKIGTNDLYHEYNTGLKITHCQSKMAAKNPRWPPRNFFFTFQHQTAVISRVSSRSNWFLLGPLLFYSLTVVLLYSHFHRFIYVNQ